MKPILLVKKLLGLAEMKSGLVNASFSLPEWQAVKMSFFAPCPVTWNPKYPHWDNAIRWINLYPLANAMGFPNWGQISGFYYAVKVNK